MFRTILGYSLLSAGGFIAAGPAFAQPAETREQPPAVESVVVTANRLPTPRDHVASALTVITAEEMDRLQQTSVLEALRAVPGLDIVRSGGPGQNTSAFLRGANAEHTLVLVDGVEVNDPMAPGRGFDFAHLTTANVDRIEIIRGPQSTLYGSDAIGGVINVITRRGQGPPRVTVSATGGTFGTAEERVGLTGGNARGGYALDVMRTDSRGFSAAGAAEGNAEADGYHKTAVSGRFTLTPHPRWQWDVSAHFLDSRSDIDDGAGAGRDDPNHRFENRNVFVRAAARGTLVPGRWDQVLGISLARHHRADKDDADPAHPVDRLRSRFDSGLLKIDWQHNVYLDGHSTLTLGVETERETGTSDFRTDTFTSLFARRRARTSGVYVQDFITVADRFFATVGLRVDHHSRFGAATTFRVAPTYRFDHTGTRIRGTFGTGFKSPSLFQLFAQPFGDPALQPETSTGWDAGVEQSLGGGRSAIGVTYFRNDISDLIIFDGATRRYRGVADVATRGIEVTVRVDVAPDLSLGGGYTWTDARNESTGATLIRRAGHKFSAHAQYAWSERNHVVLTVRHVGNRPDSDFATFPATRVSLDGFTLTSLAAAHGLTANAGLFGRIDNLFDTGYEEVLGFGTAGRAGYLGLKFSL